MIVFGIVGREHGVPAIAGARVACQRLPPRGDPIPGVVLQVLVIALEEAEDILEVAAAAVLAVVEQPDKL